MTRRDEKDGAPILAGPWHRDDVTLSRWALRAAGRRYEIWAEEPTAQVLFAAIERLERERDDLRSEVEKLTAERDALVHERETASRATGDPGAPRGKTGRTLAPASLGEVPLAMIGTFRVDDPHVKAAAKKEPLMALAVQVAKASNPDASELEQARLRAMATAVSRGDLETFWAASTQRSRKKL